MDGRAIHAKADTAGYADTAGSAPAMVVGHGKRTACSGQMAVQQYGTGMVKAVNHNGCGEVMTVKACTSTTPPTSV